MLTGCALALVLSIARQQPLPPRVLDDFETLSAWSAHSSEGVSVTLHSATGLRGRAMRVDFDFHGASGYALIRRRLDVDLPANYSFSFFLRGESPNNNLEFKLIDSTGDNVWWSNQRDFEFPRRWTKITRRKRHIEFAWGPSGGGEIRHVAALEIAITAGRGGAGSVWFDELTLSPLEPDAPYSLTPHVTAGASGPDHAPALVFDGDTATYWRSATGPAPSLTVDFGRSRELGGLVLSWMPGAFARDYTIELSDDERRWTTAYEVVAGNGGHDYIYLPETETRYLRFRFGGQSARGPLGIREVSVKPVEWSATRNAFIRSVAGDAPRGSYPRYFSDQMVYWTVVGASGDTRQALVSEDGAVEPFAYGWSIEPFLRIGDTLVTWAEVSKAQSLEHGALPIPTVAWTRGDLALAVTAFVTGAPGSSSLGLRYRVKNLGSAPRNVTLYLAVRPFQVNTPWQFLNGSGGVGHVRAVGRDGARVFVQGSTTREIDLLTRPSGFAAVTFDNGTITEFLRAGRLPASARATDSRGLASAAMAYGLSLGAGAEQDVHVSVPLHAVYDGRPRVVRSDSDAGQLLARAIRDWEGESEASVGRARTASVDLPAGGRRVAETLRTNVAYMLIERNGPALQPGTRAYARSWIRDGALMSAGLARLGHADAVRRFIDWFLPYQRPDGRVPCCVDARGADPVAEHDSHGELIYLIAEYWRLTGDSGLVRRAWPHVALAVAYIDSLRHTHMTPEYETDSGRVYFGLLPPSISHEGYSAKPMHSYWDDFFALKGLSDATELAAMLGRTADASRFATIRDEFRRDLLASIRLSMTHHRIDYIPGSADLGDFDATSTTIAIAPGAELTNLPDTAVVRTFEKYYENFRARRDGSVAWDAYTPYELRAVGTFIRLGWKDRAHELLDFFFAGQRPAAWRQWAEVVWRDSLSPKFIGDMPHAWVASDYVRSILDFFAYERASDGALVIGAGIPGAWVREGDGVAVRGLRTYYGALGYAMRARGDSVVVRFDGDLRVPPAGIIVSSPLARPIRRASADGEALPFTANQVQLRRMPRQLVLGF